MRSFTVEVREGENYPFHVIESHDVLANLMPRLMALDVLFGIDIETMALQEYKRNEDAALCPEQSTARLVQIFTGKHVFVIDCLKCGVTQTAATMRQFLQTKRFIAHYAVFELSFFSKAPWNIYRMNCGCTHLLGAIVNHAVSPDRWQLSLKALSWNILKIDMGKQVQASDWGVPELTFEQLSYAALDAIATFKLAEYFAPCLNKFKLHNTYQLLKKAQHPIVAMQLQGLDFDVESHLKVIDVWKLELHEAKREVTKITGLQVITGPKLGQWLASNLEPRTLRIWPLTDKGKLKTDAHTFADFAHLPIVKPFERYQKLIKLTTTYGYTLIEQRSIADFKLHSSFNLTGAYTGRLSSSHPNFQNMPRYNKKDKSVQLRQNFIAPTGMIFLCADYSQIELRVAAEISQDKVMQEAFRKGIDLHKLTAADVAGKKLEDVTDIERSAGKAFNFGLLFGLGAEKFCHYALKSYGVVIPPDAADERIDKWRKLYGGYFKWQMEKATECRKTLKCRTPFGKLRRLEEGNTYGAGMNTPIQGGAAEVVIHSLIRLQDNIDPAWQMSNTVHDENMLSVPFEDETRGKECMYECMKDAYLDVFPKGITNSIVEVGSGTNWAHAK